MTAGWARITLQTLLVLSHGRRLGRMRELFLSLQTAKGAMSGMLKEETNSKIRVFQIT